MPDFSIVRRGPSLGAGGPGGPDDPAFEKRIATLEARIDHISVKIDRIDAAALRIEPAMRDIASKFADLNARVAGVEGHLKAMPTFIQLAVALISTWVAGTAVVFALLKATHQ